jgi:hypothetical protein
MDDINLQRSFSSENSCHVLLKKENCCVRQRVFLKINKIIQPYCTQIKAGQGSIKKPLMGGN